MPAAALSRPELVHSIMERTGSWPSDRNPFRTLVARARSANAGESQVERRAAYLRELVSIASIEIEDRWTLAGVHLPTALHPGESICPDPTNPRDVAAMAELGLDPGDFARLIEADKHWQAAPRAARATYLQEQPIGSGGAWGSDIPDYVFRAGGWSENHSIRDYAKAIRIGYAGLRAEIAEARMVSAACAADELARRECFWRAAGSVCSAGELLARRYAAEARRLAGEAETSTDRSRLLTIAETCDRVPAQGARTLHEATQALWLLHILTCGEDGINANSLGRVDQILEPYYQADLAAGIIDRDGAVALMEELACRLYLTYDVQAITLGGVDADGDDAVCDMSYIILDATANVGFVRDVSVRLHEKSPTEFVRRSCELIAGGGGIPFIFNDDCFIQALTGRGIAPEDARNYAPIGCIELTVPGKTIPRAVSGWFNALKCVELALFDGVDPRSGRRVGPATGSFEACSDFASFVEAYKTQVAEISSRMVEQCGRGELAQRDGGPLPCWSLLTDDCIRRGRDITDGGAVYNYHSICLMGVPDTADSLAALKKLVFDEKRITRPELLEALRADFAGRDSLRRMLLRDAPKYGNDVAEVDDLARMVSDHFIDLMDAAKSPTGARYFVHLFTFQQNLPYGRVTGATPDGRHAGEPLAYSLSAHQGRDVRGVTAMLNSLARQPHSRAAGASAAIVEVDPALVAGEAGVELLRQLTRTALAMGVGQLQWNVVNIDRLKLAQEDPEHYGNISVRVAGYSQMFKLIPKDLQDHIIARTKHTA